MKFEKSKENHIYFTLKHKDCVCPHCKAITNKVHDYRTSIIKDSPIMGKSTFLHYRKRRYHCDSCNRHFTEPFSLLPKNCRLTTRLCFEAIHLLKSSLNVNCRLAAGDIRFLYFQTPQGHQTSETENSSFSTFN